MFLCGIVWRREFGDTGYGAFWWFELSCVELGGEWHGGVDRHWVMRLRMFKW